MELSPGLKALGADPLPGVSGVLGVIFEDVETRNSVGEVGISSPVECTGGGEQVASLLRPDTVGVSSRRELMI